VSFKIIGRMVAPPSLDTRRDMATRRAKRVSTNFLGLIGQLGGVLIVAFMLSGAPRDGRDYPLERSREISGASSMARFA
jgi:hypothetical protein